MNNDLLAQSGLRIEGAVSKRINIFCIPEELLLSFPILTVFS